MSIKIGDRVKFLNDVGGGIVSAIVDKKIVSVRTDDNWEIPMMVNELIRVDIEDNMEVVRKYDETGYKEPETVVADKVTDTRPEEQSAEGTGWNMAVYFALEKKDPSGNSLNAYLINDTDHFAMYNYVVKVNKISTCRETGILEPDTKVYLETFGRDVFRHSYSVTIQLILFKEGIYKPVPPAEKTFSIDYHRFFEENHFVENDFFDNEAILINCAGLESQAAG
jgi:hypothetical protein